MNVKDKIVAITGGASGIGFKCAEQFLLHNAKVVAILDLPSPTAENAISKLKQFGENRAIFIPCDVTKKQQLESAFNKIVATFGGMDIVINAAGITNETNWEYLIDVNFMGVIRSTYLALDIMGKHKGGKGGTIVNVSSIGGFIPIKVLPTYCATKHGIIGFSRSVQLSYDRTGVRLMVMCPGMTDTALTSKCTDISGLSFLNEAENDIFDIVPKQPAEHVAKSTIQLIEKGKNGDICGARNSEPPFLVKFPTINDITKQSL